MAVLGLRCGVRASHCSGFSCGALALGTQASVVVAHRLSSCGSWALEHSAGSVVVARRLSCSAACGIFPDRARTRVPCIGRRIFNHCTTREAQGIPFCIAFSVVALVIISLTCHGLVKVSFALLHVKCKNLITV